MVTAGLLLYVLICCFPTGLWLFDIATPFRLQMALVALGIAAANAWNKRKYAATFSVFCALYLSSNLPGLYASEALVKTDQPSLRLLHWNTWRDVDNIDDLHWVLSEFQPDLAFFQEVTPAEAAEFQSNHYRSQYIGDFLILSKSDLRITVPAHAPVWSELPVVEMSIDFEQREIDLYSIHPPAPFTPRRLRDRNQFSNQLAHVVASSPNSSVVIGDFNMVASEASFQHLQQFAGLKDSATGFGLQTTWPFDQWWNPLLQIAIDQCLACPQLKVVERQVADSRSSNHRPLIVDLQWATNAVRQTRV